MDEETKHWIERANQSRNPGLLTERYIRRPGGMRVYPGSVRGAAYSAYLEGLTRRGIAEGKREAEQSFIASSGEIQFSVKWEVEKEQLIFVEDRGYIFLPWQLDYYRAPQPERTVIGLTGVGKTAGIGMLAMAMCAMTPHFKFMNVAPRVYQSELMTSAIREQIVGTEFEKIFIKRWVKKPHQEITFHNGASAEFMNVEKNADNIQSWWGDFINLDEAGLMNRTDKTGTTELMNILIGMATRLRGTRPDGRPRLGWLSLISMAYDNDVLWERYEFGQMPSLSKTYWSRLVTHRENPYLTEADIERIKRNTPPGQEEQWLEGKRPRKAGAEFSSTMLSNLFGKNMISKTALIKQGRPGIIEYEEERQEGNNYLIVGDPGQGEPPYRNAPVVQVWNVTDFPKHAAKLVAFRWIYANGSYMPFIRAFEWLAHKYNVPLYFRGYDSTAAQKAIAELAWASGEMTVVQLAFDGSKKYEYLNALKILLSRGLLRVPEEIEGFKSQFKGYELPDEKLSQDIVATTSMAAKLMYPLYQVEYINEEKDSALIKSASEMVAARSRYYRSTNEAERWRLRR